MAKQSTASLRQRKKDRKKAGLRLCNILIVPLGEVCRLEAELSVGGAGGFELLLLVGARARSVGERGEESRDGTSATAVAAAAAAATAVAAAVGVVDVVGIVAVGVVIVVAVTVVEAASSPLTAVGVVEFEAAEFGLAVRCRGRFWPDPSTIMATRPPPVNSMSF